MQMHGRADGERTKGGEGDTMLYQSSTELHTGRSGSDAFGGTRVGAAQLTNRDEQRAGRLCLLKRVAAPSGTAPTHLSLVRRCLDDRCAERSRDGALLSKVLLRHRREGLL